MNNWTPGDVSGEQVLTEADHLYNTHVNELRAAIDNGRTTLSKTEKPASVIISAFGDSHTVGDPATTDSVTDIEHSFAYLFAQGRGATYNNYALGSTQMADIATEMLSHAIADTYKSFCMLGFNDAIHMTSGDATLLETFYRGLLAGVGYLATPDSHKKTGQGAGITFANSGNWTNASLYGGTLGKKTTVQNETITFNVSGKAVIIGFTKDMDNGGNFTVTIDGVSKGTVSSTQTYQTPWGLRTTPWAIIYSGLPDTQHTVVLQYTSTGAGNYFQFDWATGNDWCHDLYFPVVWVGNSLPMSAANYSAWSRSAADTTNFNNRILSGVKDLALFGFNVHHVDTHASVNAEQVAGVDVDTTNGNMHFNNVGHAKIAAAFADIADAISLMGTTVINRSNGAPLFEIDPKNGKVRIYGQLDVVSIGYIT
ncbi:MAG: hypothetical protein WA019_00670 [Candidatus Moraniibacteriota bacterium]